MFKKNKMRGSGILVVVLSAIAFSIYSSTSFLETEHFGVMVSSYIGNIKEKYSKNVSNVEENYDRVILNNKIKSGTIKD
ncbi:unknown [Clostridium sp. CAG:921]|nr:unknown [Clostridium sp. CAG:921]